MATKKITDLAAITAVAPNTLLVAVDSTGPTTSKIQFKDVVNSIPSNATFTANVTVNGTLTANVLSASGNVSFNTASYLIANNVLVKKSTTPASSTDSVTAADVGKLWSDGNYIYFQANATHYKRAALSTW